jgi:hypothetical protein
VRTNRIWLLVLLAVLLPVRGAVAAAMLCPPTNTQGQLVVAATTAATDHGEHRHADHLHAAHDAGAGGTGGHHAGSDGSAKCNLCCDFCSMASLLSALPSIPAPLDLSAVSFPRLSAPSPSFLSDGQERPPRSI